MAQGLIANCLQPDWSKQCYWLKALSRIPTQQAEAIRGRYFDGRTQTDMASTAGVSSEQMRQIIKKGIRELHKPHIRRGLESFHDEIISNWGYRCTGWQSFRDTGISSEQWLVEIMERYGMLS